MDDMSNKDALIFLGYGALFYACCVLLLAEGYLSRSLLGTAVLVLAGSCAGVLMFMSIFSIMFWPFIGVAHFVAKLTKSFDAALMWTFAVFLAPVFFLSLLMTKERAIALGAFLDRMWGVQ